jgi:hypothetical protein
MLLVKTFKALAGDVSINLRGRQVTMTEQKLHHAQIRAMVEQVRGKGMA